MLVYSILLYCLTLPDPVYFVLYTRYPIVTRRALPSALREKRYLAYDTSLCGRNARG